jgi:hypothetical protein
MTMKLVQAKDTGKQIYLQVWLDNTKVLLDDEGNPTTEPDPEWLREWRWGKDVLRKDYHRETKLLAKLELDKMNAALTVITLTDEGKTL